MPSCTVCAHAELPAITQALGAGVSYRDIARRYAVSRSTLGRHRQHAAPAPAGSHARLRQKAQGREETPAAPARVYAAHGDNPTTGPVGAAQRGDWQALVREAEHLRTLVDAETHPQMALHYLRGTVALLTKLLTTAAAHGGH
jgi:hypothetical protein